MILFKGIICSDFKREGGGGGGGGGVPKTNVI